MIKCDYVNDMSNDEQWQRADNYSADQIHKKQSEQKNIQRLIKVTTQVTDVR